MTLAEGGRDGSVESDAESAGCAKSAELPIVGVESAAGSLGSVSPSAAISARSTSSMIHLTRRQTRSLISDSRIVTACKSPSRGRNDFAPRLSSFGVALGLGAMEGPTGTFGRLGVGGSGDSCLSLIPSAFPKGRWVSSSSQSGRSHPSVGKKVERSTAPSAGFVPGTGGRTGPTGATFTSSTIISDSGSGSAGTGVGGLGRPSEARVRPRPRPAGLLIVGSGTGIRAGPTDPTAGAGAGGGGAGLASIGGGPVT